MINSFSLVLAHLLLLLAFWRLAGREDLDRDDDRRGPSPGTWPMHHDP